MRENNLKKKSTNLKQSNSFSTLQLNRTTLDKIKNKKSKNLLFFFSAQNNSSKRQTFVLIEVEGEPLEKSMRVEREFV